MDPNDPWAIPALSDGDADVSTIWTAVGEALSTWEWLEGLLGLIFAELVAPGAQTAGPSRAYGTVVAFRGRMELIKAAAAARFAQQPNDALEGELKSVLNILDRASPRRNDIAHGIAQVHYAKVGVRTWALFPSYFSTHRRSIQGDPKYRMNACQILAFKTGFADLRVPLDKFCDGLLAMRRPQS